MKDKLPGLLIKAALLLVVAAVGGTLWYYTLGRKPRLIVSSPIGAKAGMPSSHMTAPGEMLLLAGNKVTLFDTAAGKEKWSIDAGPPRATPAPAPAATAVPVSLPMAKAAPSQEQHDPMQKILRARIAKRTAKLEAWAAQLNSKRAKLDTPLKVANFNEEEAKYHAELAEARAEKAALRDGTGEDLPLVTDSLVLGAMPFQSESFGMPEVFSDAQSIWIVQGRSVRALDHANGRLVKEIALAGEFQHMMHGSGYFYVIAAADNGTRQITRITTADGAAHAVTVAGQAADSYAGGSGAHGPVLQRQRTEFSAQGAELAQLDVRLLEEKITERDALKGDTISDWEAADKKGGTGWANDALGIVQAMSNDAQREQTGGKERIDESTYEIVLRRPFNSGVAASAALKVQGRPELFSTASMDLVAAGKTLIAFDHANKKLWEATLAFPVAAGGYRDGSDKPAVATASRPCLEDEERLYFFDKGFLTALDRTSGKTVWRLPSVGIQKVQLDGSILYVNSANGSAESLQYSQQADLTSVPMLYKLEAASGKVLWKKEKYEDCFVSQGSIYAVRETRNPHDLVNGVFQGGTQGPASRFKLYKLSARSGDAQWEWFQPRRPLQIEPDKKKVSILFNDELQVLTSIAL